MSDEKLDAAIAKVRRRGLTLKPDPDPARPPPMPLVDAIGLLLAAIDQRPARLNAGLTIALELVRSALAREQETREQEPTREQLLGVLNRVKCDGNFYALHSEAVERVRDALRPRLPPCDRCGALRGMHYGNCPRVTRSTAITGPGE